MDIAELDEDDIPAVMALWERCRLIHPDNDPRADIGRARKARDATILVGKRDGIVIATAMAGFDGHRGWVYYLAVDPGAQRSGHGKAMMNAAECWLRARKAPKLLLMVSEDNEAVLGFYRALGLVRSPVVTLGKRLD
jgi:ribosomal protein S18 acetylase RimI-like enzyme